jgi:hypothetical protein
METSKRKKKQIEDMVMVFPDSCWSRKNTRDGIQAGW